MDHLLPQFARVFGTPVEETIFVAVVPDSESAQAKESSAISTRDGIIVYDTNPSILTGLFGHEIVHQLMHHPGSSWYALPAVIEEGFAYLVDFGLNGTSRIVFTGTLPHKVVDHLLSLSLHDFNKQGGDEKKSTVYMAMYLTASLGRDELNALALQAHERGFATIPSEWIHDALDAAQRRRALHHPEGSSPPAVECGPTLR